MQHYSQRDPAYANLKLGPSKLTVGGYGCFLVSIGTLYQRHPIELLQVPGAFLKDGNLISNVLAAHCGGTTGRIKADPGGWCIGVTDHYKGAGYPTHFFVMNGQLKLQIDPLDLPARPEPLTYNVVEYRVFTNTRYELPKTWQQETEEWATEKGIITSGWETPDEPMSQVRVAAALRKLYTALGGD